MEAYLLAKEKANEKGNVALEAARVQYRAFAAENNIKLIDSESDLDNKIKITNEVIKYTNTAYLLSFKSYKNEVYLIDAVSRNDLTAIEQTRNALSQSAKEDIVTAGELATFKNDATVKNALVQLLNFYKTEADQKMQSYMDYVLAKEKFEKIKKVYDSSSKKSQDDVNAYNNAVNDLNAKSKAANAMNQELNKARSTVFSNWNNAYDSFLNKYTPKHR